MAAQPLCPYCGAKLFPHEVTNDQCASCGGRLSGAVETLPGLPKERQEDEKPINLNRPLTLSYQLAPEAFVAVRQGIHLVRCGLAAALVFNIVGAGGQLASANLPDPILQQLARAIWIFANVFQIGSLLVVVLGVCFCCLTPKGCGARTWARSIVPCLGIGGVLTWSCVAVDAIFKPYSGGSSLLPGGPAILLAVVVLAIVGLVASLCYFLLLAALARFFGDEGLAKSLTIYYLFSLLICGVGLLGTFMAVAFDAGSPPAISSAMFISVEEIAVCGWAALDVVLSLWLLGLLTRLHRLFPLPGEPDPRRGFPL